MALLKFTCTRCEKDFEAGSWECQSGESHIVADRTYYMLDAPSDPNDRIHSRNLICNVIPEKQETRGNDIVRIPGVHIEFVRGKFATTDPQIQMRLEQRKNILWGDEGKKRWENNYYTDKEKSNLASMELQAKISRLENENNKLLAEVQGKAKRQNLPVGA